MGGANNQVDIWGISLSRLGVEGMNATGVSAIASIACLFSVRSIDSAKSGILKAAATVSLCMCMIVLLWSGSRGALVSTAVVTTYIVITQLAYRSSKRRWRLLDIFALICIAGVALHFQSSFYRVSAGSEFSQGVIETFIESRVPNEQQRAALQPTMFGVGYNALSADVERQLADIECYWLKAWAELGVVGSIVYSGAFLAGTIIVIYADWNAARRDSSLGFLPSSIVLFTWANSISSWGFIYPHGEMIIQLGIMSSSLAYISSVRRTKRFATKDSSKGRRFATGTWVVAPSQIRE
jgi:O-antigen ligase